MDSSERFGDDNQLAMARMEQPNKSMVWPQFEISASVGLTLDFVLVVVSPPSVRRCFFAF